MYQVKQCRSLQFYKTKYGLRYDDVFHWPIRVYRDSTDYNILLKADLG